MDLAQDFLEEQKGGYWRQAPKLFYLWGHSYEFDNDDNWDVIERFAEKIGNRDDIWYATNGQIYDYVQAYQKLQFSAEGTFVYNPSTIDVYICYFGRKYKIPSGETVDLETL